MITPCFSSSYVLYICHGLSKGLPYCKVVDDGTQASIPTHPRVLVNIFVLKTPVHYCQAISSTGAKESPIPLLFCVSSPCLPITSPQVSTSLPTLPFTSPSVLTCHPSSLSPHNCNLQARIQLVVFLLFLAVFHWRIHLYECGPLLFETNSHLHQPFTHTLPLF